ncbi:anti-sigma regulatory factor [Planctomycetota bacterium]|nr:anti-sigma regulatory factor [Planctomycetota bacterium]
MKDAATQILAELARRFAFVPAPLTRRLERLNTSRAAEAESLGLEVVSFVVMVGGDNALGILGELDELSQGVLMLVASDAELPVTDSQSVVSARRHGMGIARRMGFSSAACTKVGTSASELARNIVLYADGGTICYRVQRKPARALTIEARDRGPGIPHLDSVLAGTYRSKRGLGMGLRGVKKVADTFEINAQSGQGTRVVVRFS